MNKRPLTKKPYLVIRHDGMPVCRGANSVLSELKTGPITVYDLALAVKQFGEVVGDNQEFSTRDLQELAGVSHQTVIAWRFAGILQSNGIQHGTPHHPHEHSRGQAFVAGVVGALHRQGIRRRVMLPIADFLHELFMGKEVHA